MAHIFLRIPAPSSTLQQDVLIALALAVVALFLPMLLVARAARDASRKVCSLEQECVSKSLSLLPPAEAVVKTPRRKKRKARKHGKTAVAQLCGQDGPADGGQRGLSDSDDAGAALEAAWIVSDTVDATWKNLLCASSLSAAVGQPMAIPFIQASASQDELQQAETNELTSVVEDQPSDELREEQNHWQPGVWHNGIRQKQATEIEQTSQTEIIPSCAQELLLLEEAAPQCQPEKLAEHGAEWECIAECRYDRMVFLLHREIRAETLRRCPPGLGPLPGSAAAMTREFTPLKGLSTRRVTLWP